ncbi:polysaccharide deacetylase family protein [Zongyangia hominis]|uniref:Polysaccharide deacetylase family protein n=1 Tax=Zongyangia hominis TaxID=2763677 RepID=A0A926EE14_9FIRM|nr:polysaccharide deacetylase family protein [Zongyangia hominis]MBC8570474.1 polysaccharide deacetylase family protein [Zongyangia hominis]
MIFPKVFKLNRRVLAAALISVLALSSLGVLAANRSGPAVSAAEPSQPETALGEKTEEKSEQAVEVPILMYHHILKHGKQLGAYTITPDEFEKDLQYIRENGYTTIKTDDLVNYVYHGVPLPEKPIMITFDDGYYSNYVYAYPLLQKYGMKAVISIIGKYTDLYSERGDLHINYSHLNWDQLSSMEHMGTIDIQNHTYNLHTTDKGRKGCKKNWGENAEEYKKMFREDVQKLSDQMMKEMNKDDTFFAYPFGYYCKEAEEVLKDMGFLGTFSSESGLNYITQDPQCLFHLKRNNRVHNLNTKDFFEKIMKYRKKDAGK